MINTKLKEKIKAYMNVQEFICDKRLPTDKDWERYFINNYTDTTSFHFFEDDFISYDVTPTYIFIKDFVSIKNKGIKLINFIIKMSERMNLPIMAHVHTSNLQVLRIAVNRYGFQLGKIFDNQYLIYREV
jgi:hypothetical protein